MVSLLWQCFPVFTLLRLELKLCCWTVVKAIKETAGRNIGKECDQMTFLHRHCIACDD